MKGLNGWWTGCGIGMAVAVLAATAFSGEPLSVRVATTPGGPQIHVNGAPVPPRFFWGSENSGRIRAGTAWTACQFDVTPERTRLAMPPFTSASTTPQAMSG